MSVYNNISQESNILFNNIVLISFFAAWLVLYKITHSINKSSKEARVYINYPAEWFIKATNISIAIFILLMYLYFHYNTHIDGYSNKFAYLSGIFSVFLGFTIHYSVSRNTVREGISEHVNSEMNLLTLLNTNVILVLLLLYSRHHISLSITCYITVISTIICNILIISSASNINKTINIRINHSAKNAQWALIISTILIVMYWFIQDSVLFVVSILTYFLFVYLARILLGQNFQGYFSAGKRYPFFLNNHAFIIILILIFSFRRDFPFDYNHYSYILMPAYTLAAGGAPLVDFNSQYGIGILYFINLFYYFSPDYYSFSSFSFIVNGLNFIFYIIVLYLVWSITNHNRLISYLLIIIVIFNRFCQLGGAPEFFPSTGFLRFGLPWIYILYESKKTKTRLSSIIIFLIIGSASIWSAEVFGWIIILFSSAKMYSMRYKNNNKSQVLMYILKYFTYFVSASLIGWILLFADIYSRSGSMPDFRRYTDFLGLYGGGFGFTYPDNRGLWSAMFVVYSNTLVYCILNKMQGNSQKSNVIKTVMLTATLGILQLTYFAFRSHENNLYHIMWPAVVILAYWLAIVLRRAVFAPDHWTITTFSVIITTIVVISVNTIINFSGVHKTLAEYLFYYHINYNNEDLFLVNNNDRLSSEAVRARQIIARYSNINKIPLIIDEGLATEILLGSGWFNKFKISFEEQDTLIQSGVNGIINVAREIPIHSHIFVGKDVRKLSALKYRIAGILCGRADLITVDGNDVIEVIYLEKKGVSGEADWCARNLSGYILQVDKA